MSETRGTGNDATAATPLLRGAGLLLRSWDVEAPADVDAWVLGHTDPEFLRWNTPMIGITGPADARRSLASRAEQAERGTAASFCVTDEWTGAILGHLGISNINDAMRVAIVGYWTLPEARGRGVASRALALASGWAFEQRGLHRLELGHAPGHGVSCRIAERVGFRAEGTLRGAMFEAGRRDAFRDVHLHGRLATDPYPSLP
ncbi:GNAT family N-acetyltransferase [Streptomyces sp. NPDC059816]|uniref:GNAT family N-acetyltransferase n=1 Tax=Streptomyces sp. NPDC059816 TaxID=3346960 RepID=UPI00365F9516